MSELKRKIEQNRKNAKLGGAATAGKSPEFLEERARAGGQTCLLRYGRDFYKSIRAMKTA